MGLRMPMFGMLLMVVRCRRGRLVFMEQVTVEEFMDIGVLADEL
jgi:hypothetical protein